MGFLFRVLFIVGIIYMISPERPALPEWLANPAASSPTLASVASTAVVTAGPAMAAALSSQSVQNAVQTLSKTANTVTTQPTATVQTAAPSTHPTTLAAAGDADPLAALIRTMGDTPQSAPANAKLAAADQTASPAPIPLPPRREPSDQPAKKI
jgi:hypothetical protein